MVVRISQKAQSTINQYKTFLVNESIKEANFKPLDIFINENDTLPIQKLAETGKCFVYIGNSNSNSKK